MRKYFYPVLVFCFSGMMASCHSPKNNSTKEEAAQYGT